MKIEIKILPPPYPILPLRSRWLARAPVPCPSCSCHLRKKIKENFPMDTMEILNKSILDYYFVENSGLKSNVIKVKRDLLVTG